MALYQCNGCGAAETLTSMVPDSCSACGSRAVVNMSIQAAEIAEANDAFRAAIPFQGHQTYEGQVVFSGGVEEKGMLFVVLATRAVAEFTDFTELNDPSGDHSFGVVHVNETEVFWAISLYNKTYDAAADDPLDDDDTRRVLTIYLPHEH